MGFLLGPGRSGAGFRVGFYKPNHDAMNQLQEYYDSITAYHNAEKFSYDQAVNQNHEMKSQESDYNIKKLKQTEIDENLFVSHTNITEIICQNCKLVFAFNNQLHQY